MKKNTKYILILLALAIFPPSAFALIPSQPNQGGTGTSTPPLQGQILLGNNHGTYDVVATSSLGISSGSTAWGGITGILSNQTDLQSALNLLVPYTGATNNVDLGSHDLNAQNIKVNGGTGSGASLEVAGTVDANYYNASSYGQVIDNNGNAHLENIAITGTGTSTSTGGIDLSGGCFAIGGVCIGSGGGGGSNYWTLSGNNIYKNVSGNVGIGTATPASALDVMGQIHAKYSFVSTPSGFTSTLTQETPISAPTATASIQYGPEDPANLSGSENIGALGYTCNGQTNEYTVYSYFFDGSTYWLSPLGAATPVTDTQNDGVSTFSVSLSWPTATNGDGSAVGGYIIEGPFGAFDTGSGTSYVDDATSMSLMHPTSPFGGLISSGQTENFSINNFSASPDYYSANGGNYSVTDTYNNGSSFWITHSITGTPVTNFQINDINENQYVQTSLNTFIQRGTLGSSPINTSPQLIQSDGSALNRDYKVYGTDAGQDTFSPSFLTASVTDPNDGNWYFITLTTTLNSTYLKYLRNINGAGFIDGQITPSSIFYDDAGYPWADGTTVTPVNIAGPTAMFENGNTTLIGSGAQGQLVVNATGVFAIPLIQWKSNNSIVGLMGYNPNSGRMLVSGGGGIDMYDANIANVAAQIGNASFFNPSQNSAGSFKVSTQNYINALEISSNHVQINPGTIGVFGATPVAQQTGDVASAMTAFGFMTSPLYNLANVSGTLAIPNGGTGATSFISGRLLFGNGTSAINTDASIFWDNSNKRLGVGTSTPFSKLSINPVAGDVNAFTIGSSTRTLFNINTNGHVEYSGIIPTINSCGTGATISAGGTDNVFRVTTGTGIFTQCIINTSSAWTNAPVCTANDETANLLLNTTSTTGTVTINSATAITSSTIGVTCNGYK